MYWSGTKQSRRTGSRRRPQSASTGDVKRGLVRSRHRVASRRRRRRLAELVGGSACRRGSRASGARRTAAPKRRRRGCRARGGGRRGGCAPRPPPRPVRRSGRAAAQLGKPVGADVHAEVRMGRGPVPNARGDLFHEGILQQIVQLAGISPDRTTGVLTPSRRAPGSGERGNRCGLRAAGANRPGCCPGVAQSASPSAHLAGGTRQKVSKTCTGTLLPPRSPLALVCGCDGRAGGRGRRRQGEAVEHARGRPALQRKVGVPADGIFGPATERALKRWQRRHGLVADGIVGPQTRSAMGLGAGPVLKRTAHRRSRAGSAHHRRTAAAAFARSSARWACRPTACSAPPPSPRSSAGSAATAWWPTASPARRRVRRSASARPGAEARDSGSAPAAEAAVRPPRA